jgi:hypothetical protein
MIFDPDNHKGSPPEEDVRIKELILQRIRTGFMSEGEQFSAMERVKDLDPRVATDFWQELSESISSEEYSDLHGIYKTIVLGHRWGRS